MLNTKQLSIKTALITLSAMVLIGCTRKEEENAVVLSTDEQIEWTEDFNAKTLQGQAVFSEVDAMFQEQYDSLDKEQKERAINTFVLSIQNQANKLSNVAMPFIQEIYDFMEEYPDVNFETGENSDQLPDGIVKSLFIEMDKTYTRLVRQTSGDLVVGINFSKLMDEYKTDMSQDTLDRLSIVRFEQEHAFIDYEKGHIDFETIWKGLDLVDSLKSENETPGGQNDWTRYFYYRALLGYEEITMEDEEGKLNESAIEAMEELIEKYPKSERAKDLTKLIKAIREEGVYGEQSHKVADEILADRFKELTEEMEAERQAFRDQQEDNETDNEVSDASE